MIIVLLKNEFNDTIFNVNFCLKDLKCYLLKFKCHFFDKKIILFMNNRLATTPQRMQLYLGRAAQYN